jgi:hypothetical protein
MQVCLDGDDSDPGPRRRRGATAIPEAGSQGQHRLPRKVRMWGQVEGGGGGLAAEQLSVSCRTPLRVVRCVMTREAIGPASAVPRIPRPSHPPPPCSPAHSSGKASGGSAPRALGHRAATLRRRCVGGLAPAGVYGRHGVEAGRGRGSGVGQHELTSRLLPLEGGHKQLHIPSPRCLSCYTH